jgi:PAS domain S-box-containing protein
LLQLLIDNLPDHIYIKDAQSRFLLANNVVQRHLGVSSVEGVVGKTDFDFSPPDLAEQYYAEEQALFQSGESLVGHEQPIFDHETGTTRWVSSTKAIFRDDAGNVAGLVGLNRDITELRQTQQNLRRFKLGIDRSVDAVFLTEIDGTIIYVNEAFEKIYGYTPEEAVGKTPRILKSGKLPPEAYQQFWATLLAKQIVAGEIVNKTKDGRLVDVEGSNNPILDENGNILGFLAIHHDITERKHIEALLSRRAAELETVAQVSNAVTTILEMDELLQTVVDLTKEQFNLYHAHVYLFDEAENVLVLAAGAGEVGQKLLAQKWNIPLEKEASLVASSARNRVAVMENDVTLSPSYFPNPLLPDTRSEMAIPVIAGDQLLGVLDVQSDNPDNFGAETERIYTSLADQIAVAVRNADLYRQIQDSLFETDTLYQASSELNLAQTYEDILEILRNYTLLGENAQQLSLNYFDVPWASSSEPEWIDVLARWPQLQADTANSRYELTSLPFASRLLRPDAPVFVEDVETSHLLDDSSRNLFADQFEAKSIAFVPLVVGGQWVGFVQAVFGQPTLFPPTKVRQMLALLAQAAVVTESIQRLFRTEQQARREQVLREFSNVINTGENVFKNMPQAAEQIQQLVPFSKINLAIVSPGNAEFVLYDVMPNGATQDNSFATKSVRLPIDGSCAGWVISHNDVWMDDDLAGVNRFLEDENLLVAGVRSRLAMPLRIGNRVLGAVNLASDKPAAFTPVHVTIMWQVADLLASALDRFRLFAESRHRARNERILREITSSVRGSLSTENIIRATVNNLGQALSREVFVSLGREEQLKTRPNVTTNNDPIED